MQFSGFWYIQIIMHPSPQLFCGYCAAWSIVACQPYSYSVVIVQHGLQLSASPSWFIALSQCSITLLDFCLVVLSIMKVTLKSWGVIVELTTSLFNSVSFCFIQFGAFCFALCIFTVITSSQQIDNFIFIICPLCVL